MRPLCTWDVVRDCHHFYTAADCHEGVVVTDALTGRQTFTGEVGKYHWNATVILDVPYCSGCDTPTDADGLCARCEIIHADLGASLCDVSGDPFKVRKVA